MEKDELLRMLDLGSKDATADEATDLPLTSTVAQPAKSADPTALDVDDWGLRRGRELLEESDRLRALKLDADAAADFHTAAFVPDPQLKPACAEPTRHGFLKQMLETPDYRRLHAATTLDDTASAIAAMAFAEQYTALKNYAGAAGSGGASDSLESEMAGMWAVARALTKATEEVTACKEAAATLGLGPGSPGANDPKAIAELYRRVRGSSNLRRICELAGRYRRVAQSRQRQKTLHGVDDMVGVTLDGDLGRLLPSELVKLAVPELELDFLRRLVERQCLAREYRGVEPVGKGPIIVSVDESGSMEGDPAHTAKALALALAWVARQQRRWCALVAYSGDTGERLLPLPPGRWDEAQLMDWLEKFIGGGSRCDVPVREMPRYYEALKAPAGKTDVIFVTDAHCQIEAKVQREFKAWKESARARLISLVLNDRAGDLADLSDEVHFLEALDPAAAAVGRVLSV